MNLIKPLRLKKGDKVALITPSHLINNEILRNSLERVHAIGLKVEVIPAIRKFGYFAGSIEERVEEIHNAFLNPNVKAIFSIRGGSGAIQLLDKINYKLIKENPKIIMGFSDVTSLLLAINKLTNLVTFHGPATGMKWTRETVNYLNSVLFDAELVSYRNPIITVTDDIGCIPFQTVTLNQGLAEGVLVGGNLSTITSLLGTHYAIDGRNLILFIEDINEEIYKLDRMLTQLKLSGFFQKCRGIIFGQFTNCTSKALGSFNLEELLENFVKDVQLPMYFGAIIGHISPQFVLPIGCKVSMDAGKGEIKLLEAAVQ